jgi:DNA-binding winged helix-turn-helix (wHTH) protein
VSQADTSLFAFRFDDYYLDGANRQLLRGGEPVSLNSKYLDVLLLLVKNAGRLVEKQRIFDEVWDGVFVTDAALTQCVKDIRRQIGDDASNPRYIKTVPKHGYIFIGNAQAVEQGILQTAEASRARAVTGAAATRAAAVDAIPPRPYKFLDCYTEDDASLFFGREREIELIHSQILAHRTFILHGRSGVGKSSLLRAGLLPRLQSEGHSVFVIRSFAEPLQEICGALAQVLTCGEPESPQTDVVELARAAAAGIPERLTVFLLDQFEEFFLQAAEDARTRFIDATSRLVAASDVRVRLVFAIREDMLSEMSSLKSAVREIFYHEYRLDRLGREQARRAITEPARIVGCQYQPELVERLLSDLGDEKGFDPPQLQIVCDSLYDARGRDGELTVEQYEQLGTAARILTGYLERVMRRFKIEDLRVTRAILTALISESGERLVQREPEVTARVVARLNVEPQRAWYLGEELVASRIVRRRSSQGATWIELAHDFLKSEVSRWLTEEEVALKRARAVIERAIENYRAHGLVLDADTLELLLPFGVQLALTGEEADLLFTSCLSRAHEVPEWLATRATAARAEIVEFAAHADSEIRVCAIEAASRVPAPMLETIRQAALWDRDLLVRKTASIALARCVGNRAQSLLSERKQGEKRAGPIRRAVSVAMIRDFDRQLVRLRDLSLAIAALVVGGLMWVRLRRDGSQIVRQGVGGILGGAGSGLTGGFLLGVALAIARRAAPIEATGLILVLGSMGFFIGALGGGGVSFGMVCASHVAYRHSRWWSVVGGALGGAFIGGSSNLVGVDVVRALFGQTPTGITGALEGASIGAGLSIGAVLLPALVRRDSALWKIAGASIGAMIAGVALALLGGNLFSASLEIIAKLFSNSQVRMDVIASLFGQMSFGGNTHVVLGALEGLLFGAGVGFGINASERT